MYGLLLPVPSGSKSVNASIYWLVDGVADSMAPLSGSSWLLLAELLSSRTDRDRGFVGSSNGAIILVVVVIQVCFVDIVLAATEEVIAEFVIEVLVGEEEVLGSSGGFNGLE